MRVARDGALSTVGRGGSHVTFGDSTSPGGPASALVGKSDVQPVVDGQTTRSRREDGDHR